MIEVRVILGDHRRKSNITEPVMEIVPSLADLEKSVITSHSALMIAMLAIADIQF